MANTWLKIKMWTRLTLISAVILYLLLFIFKNRNNDIKIDFVFKEYTDLNILLVALFTAIFSIFGWWLFRVSLRTLRQINDSNSRSRTLKLERDMAEIKSKAAMLQPDPAATSIPHPDD